MFTYFHGVGHKSMADLHFMEYIRRLGAASGWLAGWHGVKTPHAHRCY